MGAALMTLRFMPGLVFTAVVLPAEDMKLIVGFLACGLFAKTNQMQ